MPVMAIDCSLLLLPRVSFKEHLSHSISLLSGFIKGVIRSNQDFLDLGSRIQSGRIGNEIRSSNDDRHLRNVSLREAVMNGNRWDFTFFSCRRKDKYITHALYMAWNYNTNIIIISVPKKYQLSCFISVYTFLRRSGGCYAFRPWIYFKT